MSDEGLKAHPAARLVAIIPVLVIAGAAIAFMMGWRLEGRAPYEVQWRTHAVEELNFGVTAPGLFIISQEPMDLGGQAATAQVYVSSDQGKSFTVSAVRRPDSDQRPADEVAKAMGLRATEAVPATGPAIFAHDVTLEGKRTQARLIFNGRMVYQLMVISSAASFPAADATRFLDSFRLLGKT